MILPELRPPVRKPLPQCREESLAHLKLDRMGLAVIEGNGLDMIEPVQRPGETGGRILPAGEKNHRCFGHGNTCF